MENKITSEDVKRIYLEIEKTKRGSFFIDNSNKKEVQVTPNHVEEPVGKFYVQSIKDGFDTKMIEADGKLANKNS